MSKPLRIVRFEDYWDPSIGWSVPETDYEWQTGGGVRLATATAIGRDHAVDLIGWARSPREPAVETVRCTLSAPDPDAALAAWESMQRALDRIGRGRLIAERPDGSRVWCLARLRQAPTWTVSAYSWMRQPVSVQWVRLSPWWAETPSSSTWAVTASGQTQQLSIGGTAATDRVTLRLTASASAGYASPTILDMVGGSSLVVGITAPAAGAILEIDAYQRAARQSTDGGATWADVTSSVQVPAWQVAWFEVRPDTAQIRVTQATTPALSVTASWVVAYAG